MSEVEMVDASVEQDLVLQEFYEKLEIVQNASTNSDSKLILKVLRELPPLRKKLSKDILVTIIDKYYQDSDFQKSYLLKYLAATSKQSQPSTEELTPEIDLFIHLLAQLYLHDKSSLAGLAKLNQKIIELFKSYSKRSLDYLQAKIWFYIQRTSELLDIKANTTATTETWPHLVETRHHLLLSLRTATLKHDHETTASIITLLLRNYSLTNDITQAINFVSKIEFPENCGNNLYARYYYYLSKIHAIQLNYSTALSYIINSIRKAPQSQYVKGFLVSAQKLKIVIELLMGDIPELTIFTNQQYQQHLKPYMEITKAVRLGDLGSFNKALETYSGSFIRDKTYNLILRLRKNVIKTGIRLISLCYKKISIRDICIKLKMDSEVSTEYILNKLIKDHIIEAGLDNKESYMKSREFYNVYDSEVPAAEFNKRIEAINAIKKSFVKEMNYPESKNRFNSKDILEYEQEMELIRAGEDTDFDDFL
ncbi:proteasome regulatory particle lid subunit [Saccharomycopsis crataegensis]|uniref:Proteasome regulatory particle lid subunit n=1 Tax=Saccharomycopsis crataegensis TaxID=43959 RepID=A0AAV5QLU2_9ASCO|nr:proteasome regulatory particle lid subunit [Saccharomycopsis crataegensis]